MKKILILICIISISIVTKAEVSGIVLDVNGEPLIGVSVRISNMDKGTITDLDGMFRLDITEGESLEFSYVGYRSITLLATTSMRVTMQEDTKVLDEVVVVGYGTQKRSDLTGSVGSVKAEDMTSMPTSSVADMLRG